jgi:membrane-associated phospholipid phosphatase
VSFLTDFADQAVVLPLTLMVGIALAAAGWRRGAGAWVVAIAATLAAALVAKVVVYAFGVVLLHETGLESPSGHTAAAAVAYGGLIALLAPKRWRPSLLALAAASVVATVIGVTRVALHAHTRIDVVVGAVIGIAGAVLLARLAGQRPPGTSRALPLAALVGVMVLLHGTHLQAESEIERLAHLVWPMTMSMAARL